MHFIRLHRLHSVQDNIKHGFSPLRGILAVYPVEMMRMQPGEWVVVTCVGGEVYWIRRGPGV